MSEFNNQTVVITGASRGIGAAAAREFAALGANVVLAARSTSDIDTIAAEIIKSGGKATAIPCDVSDPEQVENLIEQASKMNGTIDVLINNAGVIDPIGVLNFSDVEGWSNLIDVNLKGVYYGIRFALPLMKAHGHGTIITIGSGAATTALEGWAHYCSSKAAVHQLNACLHKEEGANNIRALVLSPGTVATDMQTKIADSGINPVASIPWDDHIPAEWAAKAMVWMATPDSDEWLGQVVSLREQGIRSRLGLS